MNGRPKHREFIESVVDRVPSDSFCGRGWAAVVTAPSPSSSVQKSAFAK